MTFLGPFFQSVGILIVWWVNCHVKDTENFDGIFLHIINIVIKTPHYSIHSVISENFLLNVFYMKLVARWRLATVFFIFHLYMHGKESE